MEINIITLTENTATFGYLAEWGQSLLVEADGIRILLDTGLSFTARHNAGVMGIDLSVIDCIVLSHGHVDHTGGLPGILKKKGSTEIIAHPDIWTPKYVRRDGESQVRSIGIPLSCEKLEALGARFNLSREPVHITDHILTTGEIPMITGYEKVGDNLFIKEDGKLKPDPLADDQALIIDTEFGMVVILGCGHRGMINTALYAQKLTGNKTVYAILGGTHLIRASQEQIEKTITDLKKLGIKKLGVSHCTGFSASVRLAQEFGDAFFLNNTGNQLKIP